MLDLIGKPGHKFCIRLFNKRCTQSRCPGIGTSLKYLESGLYNHITTGRIKYGCIKLTVDDCLDTQTFARQGIHSDEFYIIPWIESLRSTVCTVCHRVILRDDHADIRIYTEK